ncbi:LysR family transcriptional regulator [Bacillus solimangrovi]|uniref:LysR family transcriptional regulator n=1 Tax=Bacillus solimangrovi TaxID=1305675 RepID=A0A1E5LG88_9BACI|nr:LysR family transcriptional regulator [Bacillus solimangrovi]OEH93098.1 LysR family transcriptional regulator [Bacillus solimangrovi]
MKIEWLEAFQITAETQSLTKASEILHMSQPALSKQIRNLEEDLGVSVFIRSSTGVRLTQAGEILLKGTHNILREINSVRKEISLSQGVENITIGSWPSIATSYLPYKLAKQDSKDRFKIKISHSFLELLSRLENGLIDVALFDDREIQHSYYSKPLFSESFLLYINVNHPLYSGQASIAFDEIKSEEFLVLSSTCDARTLVEKEFNTLGSPLKIASEIEFGQSILGFVEANLGITILPELFIQNISDNVKAIPIDGFNATRNVSLIASDETVGKRMVALLK